MGTIIILAGGLGTRIKDTYPDIPKCLIPIGKKTFLEHQIRLLEKANFQKIILSLGHLGHLVEQTIDQIEANIDIHCIYDGNSFLGTGGAIKKIIKEERLDKVFFVMYGDSYLPIDYQKLFKFILKNSSKNLMCIKENKNPDHINNVILESSMKIKLYDKLNYDSQMSYIDYGLNLIEPKYYLKFSKNKIHFDLSEFHNYASIDRMLDAFIIKEKFYEVGSLNGISELKKFLSK